MDTKTIVRLRKFGLTYAQISKAFNMPFSTVWYAVNKKRLAEEREERFNAWYRRWTNL